jgi:hypothetical protein
VKQKYPNALIYFHLYHLCCCTCGKDKISLVADYSGTWKLSFLFSTMFARFLWIMKERKYFNLILVGISFLKMNSKFEENKKVLVWKFAWRAVFYNVRFEVIMVDMKTAVFWDITPCDPFKIIWHFGGTCRLHLQGKRWRWRPTETSVDFQWTAWCYIPEGRTLYFLQVYRNAQNL